MALLKTAHRRTPCSKPTRPADKKPVAVELELLIDPEAQLADRDTALAKLRAIVEAKDVHSDASNKLLILVYRVADELENARDLVGDVTVAYTRLAHSCFYPDEPIERSGKLYSMPSTCLRRRPRSRPRTDGCIAVAPRLPGSMRDHVRPEA